MVNHANVLTTAFFVKLASWSIGVDSAWVRVPMSKGPSAFCGFSERGERAGADRGPIIRDCEVAFHGAHRLHACRPCERASAADVNVMRFDALICRADEQDARW